jgi:hypothetical protein
MDKVVAFKWIKFAAENGSPRAITFLENLFPSLILTSSHLFQLTSLKYSNFMFNSQSFTTLRLPLSCNTILLDLKCSLELPY